MGRVRCLDIVQNSAPRRKTALGDMLLAHRGGDHRCGACRWLAEEEATLQGVSSGVFVCGVLACYSVRMRVNGNTRGVLLALIGGTGWGFSGACSQFLFAQGVDPLWASAVAMLIAGAVLMLYVAARKRQALRALSSDFRSIARLVLFSLVGLTLCRVTYLLAIQYSNAGTATVLQYVGPVLIVVASCLFAHRSPSAKEVVAVMCVVVGTYLLATHGNPSTMALSFEGVFWGLSAAVAVAIYSLLPGSLMRKYGSIPVVACGLLLGGMVLYVGAGCWNRTPDLDFSGLLAMYGGLTGIGTLIGFAAYLTAINDIGAARASLLASVETVSATLCALLWLHTEFAAMDLLGFALIMATVFILAKKEGTSQDEEDVQEGGEVRL